MNIVRQNMAIHGHPTWRRGLLLPLLAAIVASDELSHGLIRRARLHLIVTTLALAALGTAEQIRHHALVHFEHFGFTFRRLFNHVSPHLGIEFRVRHGGDVVGKKLPFAQAREESTVVDIGTAVQIRYSASRNDFIDRLEIGIFPDATDAASLGLAEALVKDALLQIDLLLGGQKAAPRFDDALCKGAVRGKCGHVRKGS